MSSPPSPVWDPNQPQPKKQRSTLKIVLIVIVAVVVLCGGAIGTGIYFLVRTVDGATQPMRDAATGYLDDLRAQHYDTAYGRLCRRARGQFSQAEFTALATGRPLTDYKVVGFNVVNRNGLVDGNVTVRWTQPDGTKVTHIIPMLQDGDTWRVCGDPD